MMNTLNIDRDEVHIWQVSNDLWSESESFHLLTNEEKTRASKFRFIKDRKNFIIGRAVLKTLASSYLNRAIEKIHVVFGEQGKPGLKNETALKFNLSHSKNQLLLAFTKDSEIGVDIEFNQTQIEIEKIAKQFFAPAEIDELKELDHSLQLPAFYRCWTRKEAVIKALGGGLSIPLDRFVVSFLPNESARMKRIDWQDEEANKWTIHSQEFHEEFTGAIAVRTEHCQFKKMGLDELIATQP